MFLHLMRQYNVHSVHLWLDGTVRLTLFCRTPEVYFCVVQLCHTLPDLCPSLVSDVIVRSSVNHALTLPVPLSYKPGYKTIKITKKMWLWYLSQCRNMYTDKVKNHITKKIQISKQVLFWPSMRCLSVAYQVSTEETWSWSFLFTYNASTMYTVGNQLMFGSLAFTSMSSWIKQKLWIQNSNNFIEYKMNYLYVKKIPSICEFLQTILYL